MNEQNLPPIHTPNDPLEQIKRAGLPFFVLLFAAILCQLIFSFTYGIFYNFVLLPHYGVATYSNGIVQILLDVLETLLFSTLPLSLILIGFWLKNKWLALIGVGTHAFFVLISFFRSAYSLIELFRMLQRYGQRFNFSMLLNLFSFSLVPVSLLLAVLLIPLVLNMNKSERVTPILSAVVALCGIVGNALYELALGFAVFMDIVDTVSNGQLNVISLVEGTFQIIAPILAILLYLAWILLSLAILKAKKNSAIEVGFTDASVSETELENSL